MSIIEKLSDERVVDFSIKGNMILVQEQCDYHFVSSLTRKETLQLIEELKEMVNRLTQKH